MNKQEQWRNEGMAYCIRFLEQHNNDVEALKEDVRKRGAYGIPVAVNMKAVDEFVRRVKENTLDTCLIMMTAVNHDVLGVGRKRANRVMAKWNEAAQMLLEDSMNFAELQNEIASVMGMKLTIRCNGENIYGYVEE